MSGGAHRCTDEMHQLNESGWAPQSYYPSRPYCLAWGLNDSEILRPSQLIYIAEAMGWMGYGVAYWNGTNANNQTATDNHARVRRSRLAGLLADQQRADTL